MACLGDELVVEAGVNLYRSLSIAPNGQDHRSGARRELGRHRPFRGLGDARGDLGGRDIYALARRRLGVGGHGGGFEGQSEEDGSEDRTGHDAPLKGLRLRSYPAPAKPKPL